MKSQTLSKENFYTYRIKNKATKHFLLLGSDAVKEKRFMRNLTRPKIKKDYAVQVPGFWGTLGFANGKLQKRESEKEFLISSSLSKFKTLAGNTVTVIS